MIRQIFNEVLNKDDCTPETWRRIRIQLIHKNGDVQDVGNVRPICALRALYKLFSTLLYIKLHPKFDLCQQADQGGFKRSHQTVDHLMVNRMLEQRCREWCILMFISTIDFRKPFDKVKHQSLWNALKHFGIDLKHIDLLKKIH